MVVHPKRLSAAQQTAPDPRMRAELFDLLKPGWEHSEMLALPDRPIRNVNTPRGSLVRRFGTLAGTIAIGAGILIASSLAETTGVASIARSQGATPWPGFADVVDKIKPTVVSVRTKPERTAIAGKSKLPPEETPLERFFRRFGQPDDDSTPPVGQTALQGAAFISPDGYAVTNIHVVDGVKTVEVATDAGKIYMARVIGADELTDIALIKVDGRSDFPIAKFAERTPRVGDWVGVVITSVDDDGAAAEYGLKIGDVILEAGGRKAVGAADLRNAVQAAEKGGKRTVLMRVRSGTTARYVTLPVGRG
jgi:S1-C subfamily serine protease